MLRNSSQKHIPGDPVLRQATLPLGRWPESPSRVCLCCILKVMETLVKRDSGSGGFSSLMSAVLEKQTLSATAIWQLLLVVQETKTCPSSPLMEEIRREPGADAFFRAGSLPALVLALSPRRLLSVLSESRKSSLLVVFHIPTIRSKD